MRRNSYYAFEVKPTASNNWRTLALTQFPEHEEFVSFDDEEYGIYHLFFALREQFAEAIAAGDTEAATKILDFAGRCLRCDLTSDTEDISGAAGVSLFEHIFEDTPPKHWRIIFSCMSRTTYLACRPYVEDWMEADAFSNVENAAKEYYG